MTLVKNIELGQYAVYVKVKLARPPACKASLQMAAVAHRWVHDSA